MDFTQSEDPNDKFIVMSSFKIAKTDTTGIATFTKLSVMEVAEYSCISFVFYVGSPGEEKITYIRSVPTD